MMMRKLKKIAKLKDKCSAHFMPTEQQLRNLLVWFYFKTVNLIILLLYLLC